jgi:hypothetical protein
VGIGEPYRPWSAGQPATREAPGLRRALACPRRLAVLCESSRAERANIAATTESAGHSEPERKRWGRVVAYVRDPFGTLVEPASPTD